MHNTRNGVYVVYIFFLFITVTGCKSKNDMPSVFEALDATKTGLYFNNKLTPTPEFNMFKYMYFYNGGGIGAGDFNNDGHIDLYFSSNQGQNKIYLNQGNLPANKGGLKFTDVTDEAQVPQDKGWSTGVSIVDINNDELLDIYVCRVGIMKHCIAKSIVNLQGY